MRMHGGVQATTVRDRSDLTPTQIDENFARRIAYEMERRRWSQERLAREMTQAGCRIHQSAISKIVKPRPDGKRRAISIGEAVAFSRVFELELEEMFDSLLDGKVDELRLTVMQISMLYEEMNKSWRGAREFVPRLLELMQDDETWDAFSKWVDSLPPEEKIRFNGLMTAATESFPKLAREVSQRASKPFFGMVEDSEATDETP